jgi:hypothetical protein
MKPNLSMLLLLLFIIQIIYYPFPLVVTFNKRT